MSTALRDFERILFINPFGIGDVLFTTPLVSAVKRLAPKAQLGFVCNRRVHPILAGNADLDWVWVFERDEWRQRWSNAKGAFLKEAWKLHRDIAAHRFELAFDLSLSNQFGFFLATMGVPLRVGFCYRGRGKFLNRTLPLGGYADKHVAQYQLELLHLLDEEAGDSSMSFACSREAAESAASLLRDMGLGHGDGLIGIAPGGGDSWGTQAHYKRWSPGHFAGLCDRLAAAGHRLILLGSDTDNPVAEKIQKKLRVPLPCATGRCSLETTAALIKRCEFIVTNDGGLLHMAVAQDVPTVSFFGPTDEKVYGPFPRSTMHLVLSHDLECRPCYNNFRMPACPYEKKCLEELSPEEAFRKIENWSRQLA